MKNRIRIARGTKADLEGVTENIPAGVPIYTTDENKLYIGQEGKKGNELEAINAKHADSATNADNADSVNLTKISYQSSQGTFPQDSILFTTVYTNRKYSIKGLIPIWDVSKLDPSSSFKGVLSTIQQTDVGTFFSSDKFVPQLVSPTESLDNYIPKAFDKYRIKGFIANTSAVVEAPLGVPDRPFIIDCIFGRKTAGDNIGSASNLGLSTHAYTMFDNMDAPWPILTQLEAGGIAFWGSLHARYVIDPGSQASSFQGLDVCIFTSTRNDTLKNGGLSIHVTQIYKVLE